MSEWADHATSAARQDIDQLLDQAVAMALGWLNGSPLFGFGPFAVIMQLDGEIHTKAAIHVEGQDPNEEISRLWGRLIEISSSLLAAVVVEEIGDDNLPYMQLAGEHREAPSFGMTAVWRRQSDGQAKFGPVKMTPIPGRLFE